MTIAQLISSLFNLGAQTSILNSGEAARDFWLIFAVGVVIVIATFAIRSMHSPRSPRLPH